MRSALGLVWFLAFGFLPTVATAQEPTHTLARYLLSNGGGPQADGSARAIVAVGGGFIGMTSSPTTSVAIGFWVQPQTATAAPLPDPVFENELHQNVPNPFNPSTSISFSLGTPSHVGLRILDIRGRLVEVLVDSEMPAGRHAVQFQGNHLASGTYFYRLDAGGISRIRRMVLIK